MNQSVLSEISTLFSNFRISPVSGSDTLKAMVSCKVADTLYLTGLRVLEGKNGRFVGMPTRKDNNGEYRDIFFPASREVRDELQRVVLEKFDEAVARG